MSAGRVQARSRPVRGDRVRVPKGAYIKTTHPNGDYLLSRSQVVTVHHTLGYGEEPIIVCWPGTGGYWREAFEWEAVHV